MTRSPERASRRTANFASACLAALLCCGGCHKAEPPVAKAELIAAVGSPVRYAVGQKTHCAVSGEEFVVAASTVQVEHGGKFYAFCCEDCRPSFEKNPAKYAK